MGDHAKRLPYLDSIRGLAALIVVICHVLSTDRRLPFPNVAGFKIFWASTFAVSVFFVLSGLVLYRQLQSEKLDYVSFLIRRFFRLFPACIFAVTVSYLCYVGWQPAPVGHLGTWFNDVSWPVGISFSRFLMNLTLTGEASLLRPIWTLVLEWKISLIFPIIVAFLLTFPRSTSLAFVGLTICLGFTTAWQGRDYSGILLVAFFTSFFVAGALIARHHEAIASLSRPLRYVLLLLVLYFVVIRGQPDEMPGWVQSGGLAAVLVTAVVADARAQKVLAWTPLVFLGRISYSLYLCHMIWIGVLFRVLDGSPPMAIAGLVIVASIGTAAVMQKYIEAPAVRCGKRIARRIAMSDIRNDVVGDDRGLRDVDSPPLAEAAAPEIVPVE